MTDEPRHIPWERRPVTDPAAARATALQSMNAQPRLGLRRKPQPAMTLSARRYLQAEIRWAAFLRRRKARIVAGSHRSGRDQLDVAKAKRARLPRRTDATVVEAEGPMGESVAHDLPCRSCSSYRRKRV